MTSDNTTYGVSASLDGTAHDSGSLSNGTALALDTSYIRSSLDPAIFHIVSVIIVVVSDNTAYVIAATDRCMDSHGIVGSHIPFSCSTKDSTGIALSDHKSIIQLRISNRTVYSLTGTASALANNSTYILGAAFDPDCFCLILRISYRQVLCHNCIDPGADSSYSLISFYIGCF